MYSDNHRAPIVINVMLHVYSIAEPLETSGLSFSRARSAAIKYLIESGCIVCDPDAPCGYTATDQGRAYVQALLEVKP